MSNPDFSAKSLAFLNALKRHNNREWFRARRDKYEAYVREPMIALVERLSEDLRSFAPDLVASPKTSIYRIYRDTRFSANKTPLKTHVSAIFPHRLLSKHGGAGLYIEISGKRVLIGGGLYRPEPKDLNRVRAHIGENYTELRNILEESRFKRNFGSLSGAQLKRIPRGFALNHPAGELLRFKQFLVGCERPAEFATSTRFYTSLLRLFRQVSPLIHFLNTPLADWKPSREESVTMDDLLNIPNA